MRAKILTALLIVLAVAPFVPAVVGTLAHSEDKETANHELCKPGEYIFERTENGPRLLCFRSNTIDRK